jgi:hypothetical protein
MACVVMAATAGASAESFVSDFAFVMSPQWFLLPGNRENGTRDQLQFRRFSVVVHKADFDSVRSGAKDDVKFIGDVGTFYNSLIYTCQKNAKKSDFLTFHFPVAVSPASFRYDDWKPKLDVSILADKTSTHLIAEYMKGDIFVDANAVGVETFLQFVGATALTVDFGDKGDRLNFLVADSFATTNLSGITGELVPVMLGIKPNQVRIFSNMEMVKRCLEYKRSH